MDEEFDFDSIFEDDVNDVDDCEPTIPEAIEEYLNYAKSNYPSRKHLTKLLTVRYGFKKASVRETIRRMAREERIEIFRKQGQRVEYIRFFRKDIKPANFTEGFSKVESMLDQGKIPYFPHPRWNDIIGGGLVRGTQTGLLVRNSWGKSNQAIESIVTLLAQTKPDTKILLISTEEDEDVIGWKLYQVLTRKFEYNNEQANDILNTWFDTKQLIVWYLDTLVTPEQLQEFIVTNNGFDLIIIDYADDDGAPLLVGERGLLSNTLKYFRRLGRSVPQGLPTPAIVTYMQPKKDKDGNPENAAQGDARGAVDKSLALYLIMLEAEQFEHLWTAKYRVNHAKGEWYSISNGHYIQFRYNNETKTTETIGDSSPLDLDIN